MVAAMPMTTASHSSLTGVSTSATESTATHSGPVNASTRSPMLNTGPWPSVTWWTTRR
jgi:hypothetical protein